MQLLFFSGVVVDASSMPMKSLSKSLSSPVPLAGKSRIRFAKRQISPFQCMKNAVFAEDGSS
jgi:hypothetical protein